MSNGWHGWSSAASTDLPAHPPVERPCVVRWPTRAKQMPDIHLLSTRTAEVGHHADGHVLDTAIPAFLQYNVGMLLYAGIAGLCL